MIGIKFVVGNHFHHSDPSIMKVSQAPAVTERIKGDGNCFFSVNCLAVTGSQQDHQEFRLFITSYMIYIIHHLPSWPAFWPKMSQ